MNQWAELSAVTAKNSIWQKTSNTDCSSGLLTKRNSRDNQNKDGVRHGLCFHADVRSNWLVCDLGPENENLKVKLLIEGRKSPQNDDPALMTTKSSSSHAQRQTAHAHAAPPAPPTPYSSSNTTTSSTQPPPTPANHMPPSSCPPAPVAQPNA